jgi:hypothetical protein
MGQTTMAHEILALRKPKVAVFANEWLLTRVRSLVHDQVLSR